MEIIDLVIIGAGPAGISTALHLLQIDDSWSQRMLVLEKESHPRFKLCGGGITQFGLNILQELGIDLPLPIPHAEINDARLLYKSRIIHVRNKPEFLVFNRSEFDTYLSSLAKEREARIQENEEVISLNIDEDGVDIYTSIGQYRTKVVVGADGALGITRKTQKHLNSKRNIARSLELIRPAKIDTPQFTERYATFDFTPVHEDLQGYYWDFPSFVDGKSAFNNGVYDSRVAKNKDRANLIDLLHAGLCLDKSELSAIVPRAHPIPLFSPRKISSSPRMLYVGDAAGVDPLFGEGIGPALGYGKVAAKAIQSAFSTGNFSFEHYRSNIQFSSLGRYLTLRWAIAWWAYRLCKNPTFMHAVWLLGKIIAYLASKLSSPEKHKYQKPMSAYEE